MADTTEKVLVQVDIQGEEVLMNRLANLKSVMIGLKEEQKALNKAFKDGHITRQELAADFARTDAVLKTTTQQFNHLKTAIATVQQPIKNLNTGIKETTASATVMGNVLKNISQYMIGAFSIGVIIQGFKELVNTVKDFEHQMNIVRALTHKEGGFEQLEQQALRLGKTTLYSAQEVGKLMEIYSKLGFSADEINKITEATLQLAQATGEDLAKSAMIAGSTLRAFNLDASDMQRVVDIMARSFNTSALDLENFGEAMKFVGPVAANANISLEQTSAMLAILSNSGIKASIAGTSLRKMITDLAHGDVDIFNEKLRTMGVNGYSTAEAVDEVGRTAQTTAIILSRHVDELAGLTAGYKDVTNEAKGLSDIMVNDLQGDFTRLGLAIKAFVLDGKGWLNDMFRWIVTNWQETFSILGADNLNIFEKAIATFTFGWKEYYTGVDKARQAVIDLQAKERQLAKEQEEEGIKKTARAMVESGNIQANLQLINDFALRERVLAEIRNQQDIITIENAKERAKLSKEEQALIDEIAKNKTKLTKDEYDMLTYIGKTKRDLNDKEKELLVEYEERVAKKAKADKEAHDEWMKLQEKMVDEMREAELEEIRMQMRQEERDKKELDQMMANADKAVAIDDAKIKELTDNLAEWWAVNEPPPEKIDEEDQKSFDRWKTNYEKRQDLEDHWLEYTQIIMSQYANLDKQATDVKLANLAKQTAALDAALRDEEAKQLALFEAERQGLDAKLAAGEISENEHAKAIVQLKKDFDKNIQELSIAQQAERTEIRKREFEILKKAQISQAIISGAQAAISAFASLAVIPFVGVALGLAAAAAVGVMTGIQVARIKATTFDGGGSVGVPSVPGVPAAGGTGSSDYGGGGGAAGGQSEEGYITNDQGYEQYLERGGRVRKMSTGGWFTIGGRSHAQGGTKFYGEDGTAFEAQADEGLFILKKEAHADFLREQSERNQRHGGRSWESFGISHAASGGSVGGVGGFSAKEFEMMLTEVMLKLPRPVVHVSTINQAQETVDVVESKANLLG